MNINDYTLLKVAENLGQIVLYSELISHIPRFLKITSFVRAESQLKCVQKDKVRKKRNTIFFNETAVLNGKSIVRTGTVNIQSSEMD